MKVAEARYVGPMRSHSRQAPSGERFSFSRYPDNPEAEWVAVTDAETAQYLAEQSSIEVRWKPLGRLRAAGEDAVSAIEEMSYNAKQRMVGEDGFDLDVAGNASGEELEEALQEHVRERHEEGDI